jgi:HlyD family secretion protein
MAMGRRIQVAVAALLVLAGTLWWWSSGRATAPVAWQGYAEADYVRVGPTQQGLLMVLNVARGDRVALGTPLFAQDETADRAARDQAARQLAQAVEQLANLEAAGKATEILQAQANLAEARATLERTRADLLRGETLLQHGVIASQTVDQRRADFRSAEARVQAAEAALAQSSASLGRTGEIRTQRAAVEAARSGVEMAEWRLGQRRVASPVAGRVADVLARPGETVAAGAPVVSLLPPENVLVRFFVPEQALSSIHRGDAVRLTCDACSGDLRGTISFVSPQAEYTPPVIYSEASRAKLVYLVEARPLAEHGQTLNPGQPVEVRPLPQPSR